MVIATLQREMTVLDFCYNTIIREFKMGFLNLSRTDTWRTVKSVFPNAKDQELMKLHNCQTSLMFVLAYSKFQLTYWPPSQYQNEKCLLWNVPCIGVPQLQHPGSPWLCLFIFILNCEDDLYTGKKVDEWVHTCATVAGCIASNLAIV